MIHIDYKKKMQSSNFTCSFPNCNHSYRSQEKLERHEKIHEGQETANNKDFVCPVCKRNLTTKQSLTEHLYTHRDKKLFRCSEVGCGRKFKQYSQLCNHRKLHRLTKTNKTESFEMMKNLPIIENNFNLSEILIEDKQDEVKIVLPPITKKVLDAILPSFNSVFS